MSKTMLHPGAKWLFRVRAYITLSFFAIFLIIYFTTLIPVLSKILLNTEISKYIILLNVIIIILFLFIISEIYARMSYNRWFYEFIDSNLKIERGIIWKRYSNVPYERVQNVDITRGILARIFGFSTVNIQTAGFSGNVSNGRMISEGYIPAVDVNSAEKIRDFIMNKIQKGHRHHGL